RLSGGQSNSISRLGSTCLPCRRNQLTQNLSRDLRSALAKLAHRGGQRSPQRRRHGKTGKSPFQRLHSPAMGPFRRRGVEQEILGHAEGEPEREDPAS